MTNTFSTKVAAAARITGLRALMCAAAAASAVALAPGAYAAEGASASDANREVGMYGNPASAAPFWRLQHSSDCGEMAAADVIGQITHHEPTEQQITALAKSTPSTAGPGPIWNPPGGTDIRNLPVLLKHYGIQSTLVQTDTGALEQDLAQGHKVIVILNAETIWNSKGNRTNPDHFVVVTGVDSKAGVVHLNDSGIKTGRDEKVSIATFEQARASNHWTVVTK
jgi:hypothetical protein